MILNTDGLTSTQVRLVRSIHALLSSVVSSDDESEYFESSAELLRKAAELIKHSNFALDNKGMSYGDQAVEFAVDTLNEVMDEKKVQNLDN